MLKKSIFVVLFAVLFLFCNNSDQLKKAQVYINSIKQQFVPDTRVAVFNIDVKKIDNKIVFTGETDQDTVLKLVNLFAKKEFQDYVVDINLLPDKKLNDSIYGIVRVSVLNMRREPDFSAELLSQALMGMVVKVLKYKDGFYYIQTPDKYLGWASSSGIVRKTEKEKNDYLNSKLLFYIKREGWIVDSLFDYSRPVCDIVAGSKIKFLSKNKGWIKVELADNRIGYVKSGEVVDYEKWQRTTKATPEDIIKTAFKFKGVPYLWGGTSSKMLDCSGFVRTVFMLNNIMLPRDASQQVLIGKEIPIIEDFKELQPADLLFFGFYDSVRHKERITHVGIYIGDCKFIHESGMVKVNSLCKDSADYSEYRRTHLRHVKRVLNVLKKE